MPRQAQNPPERAPATRPLPRQPASSATGLGETHRDGGLAGLARREGLGGEVLRSRQIRIREGLGGGIRLPHGIHGRRRQGHSRVDADEGGPEAAATAFSLVASSSPSPKPRRDATRKTMALPPPSLLALPSCAVRGLRQRRDGFDDGKGWRRLGFRDAARVAPKNLMPLTSLLANIGAGARPPASQLSFTN
jgi:hypothetical protein